MKSDSIKLFQTLEHRCGYYSDRLSRNLVLDPVDPELPRLYGAALERGFRRAGGHVYRPYCRLCQDCIACRVPVAKFQPRRSQRRTQRDNADLRIEIEPAHASLAHFDLYRRYLSGRHAGGGMDDPGFDDFERFLLCGWSDTRFINFREGDKLLACAVTDFSNRGLSAVYTFFDPAEGARSLGSYAILTQISIARREALPHVYLGYWLDGHEKMDYKRSYRPLELLIDGVWQSS